MSEKLSTLVYKVKQYGNPKAKTVFFFCPFGIPSWSLNLPGLPIRYLLRDGYFVVSYSYETAVATRSPQVTIDNIQAIQADVEKKINTLDDNVEVSCFGISMGTVLAANIAAANTRIKKVVLNLSYGDISEHIINLPPTRTISRKRLKAYIEAAGDEKTLAREFQPYSPLSLVSELKNKKILLYLSRRDQILQLTHTVKLRNALEAAGVQLQYFENVRGGHSIAIIYNCLRAKRYRDFLNKP